MKIYRLARNVFTDYIYETVRGKDTNEFVLRLKLSAMVYATDNIIERTDYKIYKIGRFCILIKNSTPDIISLIYWDNDRAARTTKEVKEKLVNAYRELGLNDEGNKYIRTLEEDGD